MRFDSFHLDRFGHFSDRVLPLPRPRAGEPDLHLVIGANEAGKTTLRQAIVEFLFGMEHQSRFAFLHDMRDLRLAAVLGDDEPVELQRTKGRKDTLRSADGSIVAEEELARRLAGFDKATYLRDFALGHDALVQGGRRLLDNRSDFSAMIFEAASGIRDFARLRGELEERALAQWSRDGRRRKKSRFGAAEQQLREAERAKKDAVVSGPAFTRLTRAVERARQELTAARSRCGELEFEAKEIERLQTAARVLVEHDRLAHEIAELDATATSRRRTLDENDSIESFLAEVSRTARHRIDIQSRLGEVEAQIDRAREAAHAIGWAAGDRAALTERLPAAILRRDLAALAEKSAVIAARRDDRREGLERLTRELARAVEDRDRQVVVRNDDRVAAAVAAARKLGDVAPRRAELAAECERLDTDLASRRASLRPWQGELDELEAMVVVDAAVVDSAQEAERTGVAKIEAADAAIDQLRRELAAQEAKLAERRRQREIVDRAELEAARERRDELWRQVRDGREPLGSAAEEFEQRVRVADAVADRRFEGAGVISEVELVEVELANLRAKLEHEEHRRARLHAEAERLRRDWARSMEAIGLPGWLPGAYRSWLTARAAVLEMLPRVRRARQTLERFAAEVAAATAALRSALASASAADLQEKDLDELVERAVAHEREAERTTAARATLEKSVADLEEKVAAARKLDDEAEREHAGWQQAFARACAACALPEGIGVEAVREALAQMATIEAALRKATEIEVERIRPMESELSALAETTADLHRLFPDHVDGGDPSASARSLRHALAEARTVAAREQSLRERFADVEKQLHEVAGSDDPQGLRARVEALDERARALRLGEIQAELDEERARYEGAVADARAATDALQAVAGGDVDGSPAEQAERERQAAIAELAATASDYLDTWLEARLLRWAIDRYRAEHQNPLLVHATRLFRLLTVERFTELLPDTDADPPVLLARRASGELLGVDALSDGTRDQLFLALRLAAVELQLEKVEPLPFIADDLFVNFDDERAAAGFRALADLARRTQVFYLSHHQHLVEVAQAALPGDLGIVRL